MTTKTNFSSYLSRFATVILLLVTYGCGVPPTILPLPISTSVYRSTLATAEAKAYYAFVEFRMLATDNRWDDAITALRRAVVFDPQSDYLRMGLAKALLHKEQAEESIEILRKVVQQSPEDIDGRELLGDLLSSQEQYEEAADHYRQALELAPDNEVLQMRLAMVLGQLGRQVEAISLLEQLILDQPEAMLAHLSLARFYQETGQLEKAEATYGNLLNQHPDQQQALLEYGRLLETQQLIAEALALYRQGIQHNPRAILLRQQLAALYLKQNRYSEALEQLLAVRQLVPGNYLLLGQIGLLHLELEDWLAAEADFRLLLEQGENAGRHRYYLGLALLGQQKIQQAIEVMSPIDKTSPVFDEAVMLLGYLYGQSEQPAMAISALQQVLEQGFYQPEIYYYLAAFHDDNGASLQASEVVAAGLLRFPQNVELLYQAAVIAEKRGDQQKALELMTAILAIDADYADALNFIAYHYAEKGTDLELALNRAQRALTKKKSGYIIDTLGWIYYKMGRHNESRKQLEEANSLLPGDPVILEHLGDLYRALTLWEKAAEVYRRALEIDPLAAGVAEKMKALPLDLTP